MRNGEKAPGTGRLLAGMRGMDRSGDGRICLGMDGRSAGEEGVGGTCGLSEQFGKRGMRMDDFMPEGIGVHSGGDGCGGGIDDVRGVCADDVDAEDFSVGGIGDDFDESVGGAYGACFAGGGVHGFADDGGDVVAFGGLGGDSDHRYFGVCEYG